MLKEKLLEDLKESMKEKNTIRKNGLEVEGVEIYLKLPFFIIVNSNYSDSHSC